MHIETDRLIIRDLMENDEQALYKIKYDPKIHLFIPDYIKADATIEDIKKTISYCISVKDTGNFENEIFYPIILK